MSNKEESKRIAWDCFSEIPSYARWDEGSSDLEDDIEKALDAAEQRGYERGKKLLPDLMEWFKKEYPRRFEIGERPTQGDIDSYECLVKKRKPS